MNYESMKKQALEQILGLFKEAAMESPNEEEKRTLHEEETAIDQPVAKECCGRCGKSKLSKADRRKLLEILNLTEADKEKSASIKSYDEFVKAAKNS